MKTKSVLLTTREGYLLSAIDLLKPLFIQAGAKLPKVRISTGWPSNRGNSGSSETLGECWDKHAAEDKVVQIFITPRMSGLIDYHKDDRMGILPCVVHELAHAAAGHEAHHGPKFRKLALALGLEGKMTSTCAGEKLTAELQAIAKKLGNFPHAALNSSRRPVKKQTTRMIKCECEKCGYIARVSRTWLNDSGAPICPTDKKPLKFEIDEDDED